MGANRNSNIKDAMKGQCTIILNKIQIAQNILKG
jgi:hypothetical protein